MKQKALSVAVFVFFTLLSEQSNARLLDDVFGAVLKGSATDAGGESQQEVVQPSTPASVEQNEALIEKGWSCSPRLHNPAHDIKLMGSQDLNLLLGTYYEMSLFRFESNCNESEQKLQRAFIGKYFRFDVSINTWQRPGWSESVLKNATVEDVANYQRKARLNDAYEIIMKVSDSTSYTKELTLREDQARLREVQKAADLQQKANAEQQRKLAIEADLRAGKVKPANLQQAAIVFGAKDGTTLAGAPKIRPDGKMYAMHGIIEKAGNAPEFLAHFDSGRASDISAMIERGDTNEILTASRMEGGFKTSYFKVKIPKAMQAAYFDNAKIGGGFDLVGRYVGNVSYTTVAGQEKSAPAFDAVYFVLWK